MQDSEVQYLTAPHAVCSIRHFPRHLIAVDDNNETEGEATALAQLYVWSDLVETMNGSGLLLDWSVALMALRDGAAYRGIDAMENLGTSLIALATEARAALNVLAATEE